MGFAAWCSSEGDEPLVQWTPLGFAESVWQNYTEYISNMFQWNEFIRFSGCFKLCMQTTLFLFRFVQNVLAGGMFFGQSLVRVFYPCLSLNLERFEACGAPCAKSQTRTSWSWSHLFDGWDPFILKNTHLTLLHVILFCSQIFVNAQVEWSLVKFEGKCQSFRLSLFQIMTRW